MKNKKKFNVVVHYEGAVDYEIFARDEDEAKLTAEQLFEEANIGELSDFNIDWEVCDCWEEQIYPFIDDVEKMNDFFTLTKEEFLENYSYLTEEEYDATAKLVKEDK